MKIVVYTALFGDIDYLWPVLPVAAGDARYVCFSDKPRRERGLWTHRASNKWPHILEGSGRCCPATPALWEVRVGGPPKGTDPRLAARHYKTLPHRYLDADISIWIDANVRLLLPPKMMIRQWLKAMDIASCNHPDRKGVYEEIAACIKFRKDNKALLQKQGTHYKSQGMPSRWGLASTRCVIRRHTPKIKDLNEAWWHEVETYSVRDQVSFPFVCWKAKLRWGAIPGSIGRARLSRSNSAFCFVMHATKRSCKEPPCY